MTSGEQDAAPARANGVPIPHDRVLRSIQQWQAVAADLDVTPLDVFGRVHRVFALYSASINRIFGAHDLSAPGFEVLAALYRSGAPYRLSVSELASETLISSGGMTMRLDRLERDGRVTRDRTAADRRVVYVSLTPAGQRLVTTVAREHFGNEGRMLDCLDADERAVLSSLLRRLEVHLSN